MYCLVVSFQNSFDDIGLIYKIPTNLVGVLKVGNYVTIPFGTKISDAICIDIFDKPNIDYDFSKIKELLEIKNSDIFLRNYQIELLKFLSTNYFSLIHNCLNLFFPRNLKDKLKKDKFQFTENKKEYIYNQNNKLNIYQQKALEQIKESKNNKILLFGVTGSGKTEIYINLIKEQLDKNKQSLLLIPEIILSSQLYDRIKTVFGEDVELINSSVSEAKKTKIYNDIYTGNTKIVVGTRSAIFYPYKDLGLIIMDEEHDNSYISDNSPRYKSIELLEKISELQNIKVLFGSGTPSIESMYKAVKGDYQLVNLLNEY